VFGVYADTFNGLGLIPGRIPFLPVVLATLLYTRPGRSPAEKRPAATEL
jgi:hypothetical protein